MKYLAVIDTNILVSYLLTKNRDSSVVKIIELVKEGIIVPLIQKDIIEEYNTVLRRRKFDISEQTVCDLVGFITDMGIMCDRKESNETFPDPDDIVFYEVSLSVDGSYLITGNLKHFPINGHIVTPADMLQIIHLAESQGHSICEPPIGFTSR
jgi:putative PIN family toxin of toxin-antitoxin system